MSFKKNPAGKVPDFSITIAKEILMTTRINIPVENVLNHQDKPLDLIFPTRCSRCDTAGASHFESHLLKYKAGMNQRHVLNNRFRVNQKICLRLPLCESCYQANFIEAPDSFINEGDTFGKIARWRSAGMTITSVIAGTGFILLTRIIKLPADLPWLQYLWVMLLGAALVIIALISGLTELNNRRLRSILNEKKYDFRLKRAVVIERNQIEDPQGKETALTILMDNDSWAEECADHYGWVFEKITSKSS
jgi:hypothetical protein